MKLTRSMPAVLGTIRSPFLIAAATLLAAVSCYFAARSLFLGVTLARAMPLLDQWVFVEDYFRYLDGTYTALDLFTPHNEHRIATTRIFLFIDAVAFDMHGLFPIVTTYGVFALMALLIAFLAAGPKRIQVLMAFLIALGAMWSTAQYNNLASPFQVQFAFVHFFALGCYCALAHGLTESGKARYAWLLAAATADFLGVFSLGSGSFIALPAIALAVWLRKLDRVLLLFLLFHVLLIIGYFYDFTPSTKTYGPLSVAAYLRFVVQILGIPYSHLSLGLGTAGLIAFLIFVLTFSWAAIVKGTALDRAACILLALAGFAAIEAALAGVSRINIGIDGKYATPAVVFLTSLLGVAWRTIQISSPFNIGAKAGVLALAAVTIVQGNLKRYESAWRIQVASVDRATAEFLTGHYPQHLLEVVSRYPVEPLLKRLAAHRLGPFTVLRP